MRSRALLTSGVLACTLLAIGAPVTHGQAPQNRIVELLSQGKVVLGWFAPARTPEAAK